MPHTVVLPIELYSPLLCWSDSNTHRQIPKIYDLPISLQHINKLIEKYFFTFYIIKKKLHKVNPT